MALLGLAASLNWLFIARILAGASAGSLTASYAYVSDVTPSEERGKGAGFLGAAFALGFIFGPAIGGMLSRYGYSFPMFMASLLALANAIFAFFKLHEPRLTTEMRASHRYRRFDFSRIPIALSQAETRIAVVATVLFTYSIAQMESISAVYLNMRHGFDAETVGVILSLMGVVLLLIQARFLSIWMRRQGELKLIMLGTTLAGVALTVFATTQSALIAALCMIILAFGQGAVQPSLTSLAGKTTELTHHSLVVGVFQSAGSIARILGPPCAGWFFDRMSWRSPFYGGAILLLLSTLLVSVWSFRHPRTSAQ